MIWIFNSGTQTSVYVQMILSVFCPTNVPDTAYGAQRVVQPTELTKLSFTGFLAGQISHAIPENGFSSPPLLIHYYPEIPVILCCNTTTEECGKA